MTLDGQTHGEESRAIITGQHGANLWTVGRYMVGRAASSATAIVRQLTAGRDAHDRDRLLAYIKQHPRVSQRDLMRATNWKGPRLAELLTELERRGHVRVSGGPKKHVEVVALTA